MHQLTWKPVVLALAAFSLTALTPLTALAQDHPEDHHDQNAQEHHDDNNRHDDNRGDPATQYRHDHPHASARCHDGFFTTTKDRGRACTKHGGIDVWLAL
jgi:hypothetical protein